MSFRLKCNEMERNGEISSFQLSEIYSPLANAFALLRSRLHFVSLEMTVDV